MPHLLFYVNRFLACLYAWCYDCSNQYCTVKSFNPSVQPALSEKKRSSKQTCVCSLQVWEDVLQQMPARAEIVSQLGQSAEVHIHYSASRLLADMSVSVCGPCFSRDSISLQCGLFAECQCTKLKHQAGPVFLSGAWGFMHDPANVVHLPVL